MNNYLNCFAKGDKANKTDNVKHRRLNQKIKQLLEDNQAEGDHLIHSSKTPPRS